MGLVDIQATKDRLFLSTEQCYVSGEWSIGHALDFGQQQILRIFFSFNFCFFCPELKDVWYLTVIHRESPFYLFSFFFFFFLLWKECNFSFLFFWNSAKSCEKHPFKKSAELFKACENQLCANSL